MTAARRGAMLAVCVVAGAVAGAAAAAAPHLDVRAATLNRSSDTTWTGAVTSPQLGAGRLTLVGTVAFLSHAESEPTAHLLRFRATFKRGWIRGCLRNSEYLRPGDRQVWDGTGRVTATSASLRAYRGLKLTEGGNTPAADLTVAKPFRFDADPHGGGC